MYFRSFVLRRLLRRRPPERISSTSPDWGKRNDIYVRGSTEAHEDALLLEMDRRSQTVSYVWWPIDNEQASSTEAKCSIGQIVWHLLSVSQKYHTWRIDYSSPYEAFIHDFFCLPQIKFLFQSVRDRFYARLTPDMRMKLLAEIVRRYDSISKVRFADLLVELYGPSIRLSSNHYEHLERLKFILKSLAVTGDVRIRPDHGSSNNSGRDWVEWELHGDVIPEPKAIVTLADHYDSQRKHRDTIRLANMQFILGLGMLAVAIATLLVNIFGVQP